LLLRGLPVAVFSVRSYNSRLKLCSPKTASRRLWMPLL
jgi:hypothetical protein